MKKALVILTKVPTATPVKTRLNPVLTVGDTASLHCSFLLDTVETALAVSDCDVSIAYEPSTASQQLREIVQVPLELLPQCKGDLGQRMNAVFVNLFERGYQSVMLLGSDLPTLPRSYCRIAFSALGRNEVVLGPSFDGGYYLLGLKTPHPILFEGIEWGSSRVLQQTIDRINSERIKVQAIAPWYDIDTPENFHFLVSHLKLLMASHHHNLPHHTIETLRRLNYLS